MNTGVWRTWQKNQIYLPSRPSEISTIPEPARRRVEPDQDTLRPTRRVVAGKCYGLQAVRTGKEDLLSRM